jgi:hypothetical protein
MWEVFRRAAPSKRTIGIYETAGWEGVCAEFQRVVNLQATAASKIAAESDVSSAQKSMLISDFIRAAIEPLRAHFDASDIEFALVGVVARITHDEVVDALAARRRDAYAVP